MSTATISAPPGPAREEVQLVSSTSAVSVPLPSGPSVPSIINDSNSMPGVLPEELQAPEKIPAPKQQRPGARILSEVQPKGRILKWGKFMLDGNAHAIKRFTLVPEGFDVSPGSGGVEMILQTMEIVGELEIDQQLSSGLTKNGDSS